MTQWPRPLYTKVVAVQDFDRDSNWWEDPQNVYIGMPGKSQRYWGIPDEAVGIFGKPWECLDDPRGWREAYKDHLFNRLCRDDWFRESVKRLADKTLVCWCKKNTDRDCHGDLLAYMAEVIDQLDSLFNKIPSSVGRESLSTDDVPPSVGPTSDPAEPEGT